MGPHKTAQPLLQCVVRTIERRAVSTAACHTYSRHGDAQRGSCSTARSCLGKQKVRAAMHTVWSCTHCAAMHAPCSSAGSVHAAAQPGARSLGARREVELGAAAALLPLGDVSRPTLGKSRGCGSHSVPVPRCPQPGLFAIRLRPDSEVPSVPLPASVLSQLHQQDEVSNYKRGDLDCV